MIKKIVLVSSLLITFSSISAENDQNNLDTLDAKADFAMKVQDPLAKFISMPVIYSQYRGVGPDDKLNQVINIQPVIPFTINDDWNLITRTIIPVVMNQSPDASGLADTTFTAIMATNITPKFRFGIGAIALLPTGSAKDYTGRDTWALGISTGGVLTTDRWVIGALASNIWDVHGDRKINEFQIQPIINYNFGKKGGWIFTSTPIISANWEADTNRWKVPVGGGTSKMFFFGKLPVTISPQVYYNVVNDHDVEFRFMVRAIF